MKYNWRDKQAQRRSRAKRMQKYRANRNKKWRETEYKRRHYVVYDPKNFTLDTR